MSQYLYIILAALIAVLIGLILWNVYNLYAIKQKEQDFDNILNEITEDDYVGRATEEEYGSTSSYGIYGRFTNKWALLFKNAGYQKYYNREDAAGRDVIILFFIIFALTWFFSGTIFLAPIVAFAVIILLRTFLQKKYETFMSKINEQLPGFLFALKANVQTGRSIESALIKVSKSMPAPLSNELATAGNAILSGVNFSDAITDLAETTTSRELEELCRYIIIANEKGKSIEESINTIQDIVKKKRELEDEKKAAIRKTKPDFFVSVGAIPIMFIAVYMMSYEARQFWFVQPISWALLAVVIGLYLLGIYLTKRAVAKLDDKARK